MDALALAVAAALLFTGAAATATRAWKIAASAVFLSLSLALITSAGELVPSAASSTLASAVSPMLAPVAAWALVRRSVWVGVSLVGGFVAGPFLTLLYDPFYDFRCLTECDKNPWAIAHVGSTAHFALWTAAYIAAVTLTVRGLRAPPRLPVLLLALAAWLLAIDPAVAQGSGILSGTVLLVVGGTTLARAFEARARVTDLTRVLESTDDIEATLRTSAGDQGLSVSYFLDSGSEIVDRDGLPAGGRVNGQVSTDIFGPDGVEAQVHYDPDRADLAALAVALTGPARLAFVNGRLEATVRRQARALEASRRRIVMHADSERRRLERDLHDGAQQHLLALGLALRRSLDEAVDAESRDVLHRCLASTHVVLEELRDLSHGFYPATLEQTGLGNALDGIADRSPVPVAVGSLPEDRLPAEIERAIYLLVARTAAAAQSPLQVAVTLGAGHVEVRVVGAHPTDDVLADVFAVLGGSLGAEEASGPRSVDAVHGWLPLHEHFEPVMS